MLAMRRRITPILIFSIFITTIILAVAPLFARNPISDRIWSENLPGPNRWSHNDPPPPDGKRPPHQADGEHMHAPGNKKPGSGAMKPLPPHNWNPGKKPGKSIQSGPVYSHSGLPVGKFPTPEVRKRYENSEVWRNEDEEMPLDKHLVAQRDPRERPVAKPMSSFKTKGEWLEHQIVADYPDHPLVEDLYLMIKTGSQTQWKRMPWHIYTTLPKVKHFGLYSDQQGSIAGYEIINILHDLPADITTRDEFKRYKLAQQMTDEHWSWDPQQLNTKGGWALDKYKNVPILHHAYNTNPDAKWYFMIDDDTYVIWDNLYHLLGQYNSSEPYYLGSPTYLGAKYPFAHGGSGIVVSQGAMAALFDRSDLQIKALLDEWAHKASEECCGDYITAIALDSVGVHLDKLGYSYYEMYGAPFHGGDLSDFIFRPGMFKTRPITLHHMDAFQAERLYEYEKLRGGSKGLTNAQLYRDFVLPYLVPERRNWKMPRKDKRYERKKPKAEEIQNPEDASYAPLKDGDKPLFPYLSKEDCRRACELNDKCLQWAHWPDSCELATLGLTLGTAINAHHIHPIDKADNAWVGWMIERIRQKRSADEADPLTYHAENNTWTDDDNTSEGWYMRKLKGEQYKPFDENWAAVQL